MSRFSSQPPLRPALLIVLVAVLFVGCGVPDPTALPPTDPSASPTVLAAASTVPATSALSPTEDPVCTQLIATIEPDHTTLERCVRLGTTALAQVAPTCPAGFDLTSITDDTIAAYCGGLRETAEVLHILSTDLTPTVPRPTETPFVETPIPPGFIPDRFKVVEPVPLEDMVGLPFFRDATSVWRLGAISDISGYGNNRVWLWAKPPGSGASRATIGFAIRGSANTNEGSLYRMVWETPEDVGTLTITSITGVTLERDQATGLVTFTTSTGRSGSFDLATQQWSFAP